MRFMVLVILFLESFSRILLGGFDAFEDQKVEPKIFIQNDRIRIEIEKLSHKFQIHVTNNDIVISSFLEKGKSDELTYTCYADNLPTPTTGILYVEAE